LHNLLAGAAENENDAAARYFSDQAFFTNSLRLKRRLPWQRKGLIDMSDTSRRAAMMWGSIAATTFMAAPAFAQGPTDAQRATIKSQCRSDYMAHCSSVPPGGAPALQCLDD
jgi:hypothetical protein